MSARQMPSFWRQVRGPRFGDGYDGHPAVLISVSYFIIGVALLLQPDRFDNTPSYGNLIDLLSSFVWGIAHIAVAVLMLGSLAPTPSRRRWIVAVSAHTAAIALTGTWLVAFVVRYLTNEGTTIVNCVSWSVFLALIVRSGLTLADRRDGAVTWGR